MNDQPLVSVFLVTYNQQEFIGESIESALNQDYDNLEIVIGDDCSSDNTWQIAQEYQRRFPEKIKAFRNEHNIGITGNCNEVLKRCTGKYIAFFAGDDVWLPGKIRKQLELMEGGQSIVLCYHDIEVFRSEDNKTLNYWNHGPNSSHPITGDAKKVAESIVERGNCFISSISVMAQRSAIPLTGFEPRIPHGSDWFMWITILSEAEKGMRIEYMPDVLARYRRHGSNITNAGYGEINDNLLTLALTETRYPFLTRAADKSRIRLRYSKGVGLIRRGGTEAGRYFLFLSLRCSGWFFIKALYWLAASYIPLLVRLRTPK